jgi:UDP-GlcNAc:undecaprenyl-phosphate GlcNAc-1-phosphate transferase
MVIAALSQHNVPLALATVPLAGALLGFLRYNFNPATIFLGDSGSLFVGFLLGCYGVVWSDKSATILGMTAPMMALSIPLLDTALAITRRFLRQKPIFGADRGHIHHRLLDRGFTPRKVVLVLYGFCGVGAVCSLTMAQGNFSGLVVVLFCLIAWIGIGHLGYIEFDVAGRMFVDGAFRRLINCNIVLRGFEKELAAAKTPEHCWSVIHKAAKDFGFDHTEMRLAGQKYESGNDAATECFWNIRIPISESDYVALTRPFDTPVQTAVVAPFADVIRKTLESKIPGFTRGDRMSACIVPPKEMQLTFRVTSPHIPSHLDRRGV